MIERSSGFWHTYYGLPSEILGWALLVLSLLYVAFIISVAFGAI
jgi:hypothetical protein